MTEPPSRNRQSRLTHTKRTHNLLLDRIKPYVIWHITTPHLLIVFLLVVMSGIQISKASSSTSSNSLSSDQRGKALDVIGKIIALKSLEPVQSTFLNVEIINTGGPVEQSAPQHYSVKSGDTLSAIATAHGLKSGSIILANPSLKDTEIIHEGDSLVIPDHDSSDQELNKEYAARQQKLAPSSPASSLVPPVTRTNSPSTSYTMPIRNFKQISQYYSSSHKGIDFSANQGSAVYAARAGCVTEAASGFNGGYGRVIKLSHGDGMGSLYAHLSSIVVSSGSCVSGGQLIGYSGNTGNSTGPHLHFEILKNNNPVEPLQYVR